MIIEHRGALHVGHQHSHVWSILPHFVDFYSLFWAPGVISMIIKYRGALHVGHQHSHVWSILPRFVEYYSLFWGPGVFFHD